MPVKHGNEVNKSTRLASSSELNSWKRGFTPQAEIWNGRIAIAGLIILLTSLLLSNILFSG
ncbi:high light inducible protein [Prochlorococcus marinus]|uniref:high light inducible protein n=1 Tax=Prochlorococcus marinus TaxID=1219 RepID=UPI0022B5AEF5|nr:high light inducible protein [Prochlorococcus marinus]